MSQSSGSSAPSLDTSSVPPLREPADSVSDGDRPSITEITETNGTVARFEMAYSPTTTDRFAFGPPIWQRLPSLLFVGFAAALGVAAIVAWNSPADTSLYRFIVLENRTPLVIIIVLAAIATFVRAGLRGVVITADGVETRTLAMGFPRVRRYRWAQIDRIVLDPKKRQVLFELWNGGYERLPSVGDADRMIELLERIAIGRGRQVTRLD